MSSVVLSQKSGSDQLYAGSVLVGEGGVVSKGAVVGVNNKSINQALIVASQVSAGTNPTFYALDNSGNAGGGLTQDHLQIYGYFDPAVTVDTIQEFADIYPCVIGGTAPALTTNTCFRTNQSVGFNYGAPYIGQTIGTGAAAVVACAGIPTAALVRFFLVGGSTAAFAAGIAAPSNVSVQPNVSFTYTGTAGAIYGYEVLFA